MNGTPACEGSAGQGAPDATAPQVADSAARNASEAAAAQAAVPQPVPDRAAGRFGLPQQCLNELQDLLCALRMSFLLRARHHGAVSRGATLAAWSAVVAECRRAAFELMLRAAKVQWHEVAAVAVSTAGIVGLARLLTAARRRQSQQLAVLSRWIENRRPSLLGRLTA